MKSVLVALLSLSGIAFCTPVAGADAVPLADIKLIAERAPSPVEVAAATRNSNRFGYTRGWCTVAIWRAPGSAPRDLVAVDLR